MRQLATLVLLMLIPLQAFAFCDDWRRSDTVLLVAASALTIADWDQTRQIASLPDRQTSSDGSYTIQPYETNPFLGKRPKAEVVNLYFAAALAGQLLGGCLLHDEYRTMWFSFWIGSESAYVGNNAALGIGVRF